LSVSTNENYRIHQKIKIHVLAPNFSLFLSQPTFMLSRMKLKTSVTIPQNNWFKIHMNLSGSMKYPTPPSLFQCKEVMSPTPSPCNNIFQLKKRDKVNKQMMNMSITTTQPSCSFEPRKKHGVTCCLIPIILFLQAQSTHEYDQFSKSSTTHSQTHHDAYPQVTK
jgi:hypothetical protein